ncbi:MAG TPA: hypothetical protein VHK65_11795 [Candidatus Dormibacteraeota bacterium]|nr:hypothetical protein [Candidatus Dormibacteraeota bacterium]
MTLKELAARETRCKAEMDRIQDAVSDRAAIENWAEAEQQEIQRSYSTLAATESPDSLEALKRGLFLTWFECAEPAYLTGIRNLESAASVAIIDRLEEALTATPADQELTEMLAYYFQVAEWCLDRYHIGGATRAVAGRPLSLSFFTSDAERATFHDRGLMGNYFLSLRPKTVRP